MSNLYAVWLVLFIIGIGLLGLDTVVLPLIEIKGIPAVSVLGAALILLVFTSLLNWIFKEAWAERSRQHNRPDDNQDDDTAPPQ